MYMSRSCYHLYLSIAPKHDGNQSHPTRGIPKTSEAGTRLAGGRYFRITAPEPLRGPVWFKHNVGVFKAGVIPSGKRLHSELERSTIFHGKIHYFYGHLKIAMLNYQRVTVIINYVLIYQSCVH